MQVVDQYKLLYDFYDQQREPCRRPIYTFPIQMVILKKHLNVSVWVLTMIVIIISLFTLPKS